MQIGDRKILDCSTSTTVLVDDKDPDMWWNAQRAGRYAGGDLWIYTMTAPLTEAEAIALIQQVIPGTVQVDPHTEEPVAQPEPCTVEVDALELADALTAMLDHMAKHKPPHLVGAAQAMLLHFRQQPDVNLAKKGWQRIEAALGTHLPPVGPLPAPLDPTGAGDAPVGHTHPETSRRAAETVRSGGQKHALLELVVRSGRKGVTCYEAARHPDMRRVRPDISDNQVGARMGELRKMGLVMRHETGGVVQTRPAASGEAEVHVATDRGREELARLSTL